MDINEVYTQGDLDSYIKYVVDIKNEKLTTDEFSVICQKVVSLIIEQGSIFDSFYLKIYNLSSHLSIEPNDKLSEHSNFFKSHYETLSYKSPEKYIISNIIFGLDIFNGQFEVGLKDYFHRTVRCQGYLAHQSEEGRFTKELIQTIDIKDDFVVDFFVEFLTVENISSLGSEQDGERRSVFLNTLMFFWNLECMFNNKKWLKIFEPLVKLTDYFISVNDIESQMYIHFFTYHVYGNNIKDQEEWKVFNDRVDRPSSLFYEKYAKDNNLIECKKEVRATGKKKIALICDRMTYNSPYKVMMSLLENLSNSQEFLDNYELIVYSLSYVDKCEDDKICVEDILKLGFSFYSCQKDFDKDGLYYNHLQKAKMIREDIIKHDIDILITQASGYDINAFLLATRTAPKQIFWSHGNYQYDVVGIDGRISHCNVGCDDFKFDVFSMSRDVKSKYDPDIDKKLIQAERLKFPKDKFILGCIGRLMKLNSDEYLETVATIMKKNPHTIYLACGVGNEEEIKVKLKELGILDRWYFTGQIDPHLYGHVIDMFLAPFPLGGGEALEEYRQKGKPYVCMHTKECIDGINSLFSDNPDNFILPELYTKEELKRVFLNRPIIPENKSARCFTNISDPITKNDYLNVALRLLNDVELRDKVLKEYRALVINKIYENNFIGLLDD
jgi:uncharacterized Fe-S cluster protein YjdI